MGVENYRKVDLALEQLDEAIRQFLDRQSNVSALTLAGAAEEILGRAVELRGGQSALSRRVEGHLLIHNALNAQKLTEKDSRWRHNLARNSVKHYDGIDDDHIAFDLEEETVDMLSRALHNVLFLDLPFSEQVQRFEAWYMENRVGLV